MNPGKRGFIIAAPSSGAGKTTVTLGLLKALKDRGEDVTSAKSGPDYIDPAFHAAATGRPCITLDPWCAEPKQIRARAGMADGDLLVAEGAMGLFDGAPCPQNPLGHGSTADVAAALGLPVILVIDAARRSQTTAAIVQGLANFREDVIVAGVILNRVGSARHEAMLRRAVETILPVLGAVPRAPDIAVPSRHLGLKQASELDDLEELLSTMGDLIATSCSLDGMIAAAGPVSTEASLRPLPPLGQRIAIARDEAFGFIYPHMESDWISQGASISTFSPLANEGPAIDADAVFLPGGYPELYGGRLAAANNFHVAMTDAAKRGALIYGECGGFMTLGQGMIDAYEQRHKMLGLLNVETSFAERRMSLGYRRLLSVPGAPWHQPMLGHEFHYSTLLRCDGDPLFYSSDAMGEDLGPTGLIRENVMGSYAHIVETDVNLK